MRFALSLAALFATAPALAGPLDGYYEAVSYEDANGLKSAEELRPAGCWSREIFAFQDERLSRGHQRRCSYGKIADTCEAWITVEVRFDRGLVIPYTAEAQSEASTTTLTQITKAGQTTEQKAKREGKCAAKVETGTFEITLEEADDGRLLVLRDPRRNIVWKLSPATPAVPPFAEIAK